MARRRAIAETREEHLRTQAHACPICGTDNPKIEPHYAKLYGHYVCRKCYYGFADRRQIAFLIDLLLWQIIFVGFIFCVLIAHTKNARFGIMYPIIHCITHQRRLQRTVPWKIPYGSVCS